MKTLNVPMEDEDYNELVEIKGLVNSGSWRDFFLQCARHLRKDLLAEPE